MSSIASLLVAGDEILANAEDPQAERDDANSHSESTPQHQDSPPTLAMPSDHSFVVAGEETPTNSEVHEIRLSPPPAAHSEDDTKTRERDLLGILEAHMRDEHAMSESRAESSRMNALPDVIRRKTKRVDMSASMAHEDHYDEEVTCNPSKKQWLQKNIRTKPSTANPYLAETQNGNDSNGGPSHVVSPDADNAHSNPNAFYRRRPHESPEDFKKRLLSETWEEKRRLLGIGPSCPPKDDTSPDEATLLSVPKKCESCIAFNIHAPHLNDLSECTCDGNRCTRLDPCSLCEGLTQGDIALCKEGPDQHLDHEHATKCFLHTRLAILSHETFHRATVGAARLVIVPATVSPAREDCTGKTPCSVCKRLLGMGKLACKKCRKRKYEHWHARFCFNCLRRYFNSKSQDFHLSIVTAARIVGMPTPSSGLADTLVYPMPKDIASDKASENGMLMWDLIGAGSVILGSSSAPTAGNVVLACSAAPSSSSSLAGASENCTPATPCSICESLIATGTAYCMDCRRCEFDHQHAKRCFNCLRQYLLQSQPFHVATVAAARIVGLSGVPRGLDVTPVHPMPEDHAWDILTENNALMWDLIRAGEVVVGCPSALTPSDTACDSETEDEEVGEVDDDSSAAISPRPASHEPELMEVVAQQMEEVAEPISPRPTSPEPELEPESMEIVIQQVEEDTTPPSPRPAPPCPEHMEIVTQQVEEDAGPTSPRPTSLDSEPVEIVAQQVEDVVVPTSPHPASPEPEPMEIVTHQIEEDAQPPSPPNTRGHKRKRRLSQCLSPTPEPRSSASPDPIPRTFHRPTHLPAFRYEPTRSPSPALAIRADLNLPQQSLTYTNNPPPPAAIPSSALANAIPQPPPPPTDVMDYAAVRRSREHRAWMEVQEKRNFHSQRERLRVEREGFARQLRDVERQDREVRMREVERLRGEIVRLEGEE